MEFVETQRFATWIRAIVLLPVVLTGGLAAATSSIAALVAAAVLLLLAVPNFVLRLVTEVDAEQLRIRVEPAGLPVPFLPPRTQEISRWDVIRCEVHTYRALSDREYWGKHFWGLGTGRRGRAFLYLMRGGPGVELELRGGVRILLGSARPDELARQVVSSPPSTGSRMPVM